MNFRILFLTFTIYKIVSSGSPTGYRRSLGTYHPGLQYKIDAPGFPKTVQSAIVCAAFAAIAMKDPSMSYSKGEYANAWNYNDGSCQVAAIPHWALGLPTEDILEPPAWHIHIGCDVQALDHDQTVAKIDLTDLKLYFPGWNAAHLYESPALTKLSNPAYVVPVPGQPLFNGKGTARLDVAHGWNQYLVIMLNSCIVVLLNYYA